MDRLNSLKTYFQTRHCRVKTEWLQDQLQQNPYGNNFERIYLHWLEQDWNLCKEYSLPSLPSDLSVDVLNVEKKVFRGHYLLQINNVVDISKPLPMGNQLAEDEKETSDSDNDDDNDEKENQQFKIQKKKTKSSSENVKKHFRKGPRMLQFSLFDGHQTCVAIEYQPLKDLNETMTGAKVLISGPFDVYMGTLFLRPNNVQIVSAKTFEINQVQEDQSNTNTSEPINDRQSSSNTNNNIDYTQEDIEELFADDDDIFIDLD